MAKLASLNPRTARPRGPTSTVGRAYTHEGGLGYAKDVKTELFTLAVTNFVSEDTFYESAKTRDDRFLKLIREAAQVDPQWTRGLIRWLRTEANMRTASIVAAVEYAGLGAPDGRQLIATTLSRADEPAEALAYWRGTYGRKLPYSVQRGIADAAVKLYSQRSAVKWDSGESPWRMGDVIDVCHPKPKDGTQAALFRYLLDRRHRRDNPRIEGVPLVAEYLEWLKHPTLTLPKLATWENLSAQFKMDAKAWEAVIPQMGYMALLRNLRNFEDARIGVEARRAVEDKLTDPAEVAASRQLPFRFWSAWKHSGTMAFGPALETAFSMILNNVPHFPGKTLVMIDTSGSMQGSRMSAKSKVTAVEAAAVFGVAVAARSETGLVAMYADNVIGVQPQQSALRTIEKIIGSIGIVGHGTNTWPAAQACWDREGPFDRILVFTDCQDHPSRATAVSGTAPPPFPKTCPIYVWDLAGYKTANIDVGSGRYLLGGLSDQSFKLIGILERGLEGGWPWEARDL